MSSYFGGSSTGGSSVGGSSIGGLGSSSSGGGSGGSLSVTLIVYAERVVFSVVHVWSTEIFLCFVSLFDALIQRLQNARVNGCNHIHRGV